MRARKLIAALLIAATSCVTTLGRAGDHLKPCSNDDYYKQLEATMRQSAPGEALWRVTVFPPFQAEWSVRATRLDEGEYRLTVVRLVESRGHLRPQVTSKKISARLFSELDAAFRRAIGDAQPSDDVLDDIVLDSVILRFEAAGSGCGETSTLDREKRTGRLVHVILALCNPPGEDEIFRRLEELQH
jgi:hypothetical protein